MIIVAWYTAAFSKQKKLPKLKELLKKINKKPVKSKFDTQEYIELAKKKGLKGPWDSKKEGEGVGSST